MVVFLGIILALLVGAMGGYLTTIYALLRSESLRDYFDEIADEFDY